MSLTPTQADLARVIAELFRAGGRPPSVAEMAREMDMSKGRVMRLLAKLEERGWITPRRRFVPRSVHLCWPPQPLPEPEIEVTEAGRAVVPSGAPPRVAPQGARPNDGGTA
jgi:DNA-binding transcriptional MocR family regulator